jgi:uncharacterized protein (DUF39 family)
MGCNRDIEGRKTGDSVTKYHATRGCGQIMKEVDVVVFGTNAPMSGQGITTGAPAMDKLRPCRKRPGY